MPGICRTVLCALLCLTLLPLASSAQVIRDTDDPLDAFALVDPRLRPSSSGATFDSAASELEPGVRADWDGFRHGAGGSWKGYVDRRTGRIDVAEGSGIPWIPGGGNSLGEAGGEKVDLPRLEAVARAFLTRVSRMLGIDPATLKLSPGRSGQIAEHFWLVDFDIELDGLAVEGARVVFRVNNGNLVQFGTENLPSPGTRAPQERVGRKEALAVLADHIGGFTALDTFVDGGTERLIPLATHDGRGRDLARVWDFVFRRRGSLGTWRARIDAATGEILEFQDVNAYAQVTGGVYPSSYVFADETLLPMPFANLSTGGFTNSSGQYSAGGSPSSTLSGQYVGIFDSCGPISQAASSFGNILFGASAGTDCATPGSGGAGNTHAARTQFYHLNRIMEVGRGWLPSNSWLASQLPANVNINSVCNAFWNGFSVSFFKSGSGCGNTGEIAAISLHEYGHGLDSNDGAGFSFDGGTGEAYADVTAALMLRDSCIGPGFRGTNCAGYGDACTSCTGVRDIDWAKHVSNTPHTVDNFNRTHCGSCGFGAHCESYVASEGMWDFAARDLPNPGSAEAWAVAERLWYLSRPTATTAYTCNTNNIPWTSDGCSAGSWWRTLRAVDDDDGNLANGTPHSCHLFAAFNRHGMACAADAGANVCFSGCTPPPEPTLGLAAGNHQVGVSWTSSGAGAVYDVFRSDAGCDAGFVKVADGLSGTAFTDIGLANGLTYSYQVVARGAGNAACAAPPTECQSATPQLPPCPSPPPAPTGLAAMSQGIDSIALSWSAVPGAAEYHLYRSASSGGPYSLIQTVAAPATGHLDAGLEPGTPYFYAVRAATAENCVSVNSSEASAATVACETVALYENGFESGSGLADWTVEPLNASLPDWRGIQTCTAHGGSKIFRFGGETCGGSYADGGQFSAARPQQETGFEIPAGSARTRLSFWHSHQFEFNYDGGTLKLSLDGGAYNQVPASALSGVSYNGSLNHACLGAGPAGTPIFTGSQSAFQETEVDLDAACDAITGGTGGCAGHTLRIGFNAMADCIISFQGWFLDDVNLTTCVPHGCTGAPVVGTATTPADNQVLLTWSNGAPASSSFNVYRAQGTCASHGPFKKIAAGVTGSFLLDSPVSGSTAYAYQVAGLDSTGVCESDRSACIDVVPTGPCTLPPTFAGLSLADDPVTGTCSVELSWSPATPSCNDTVSYDVFRSTDPSFVPSPANRIATGLAGTSFQDLGTLQYGTPYHYVVRAVSSVNGLADANIVRRSAVPTGPLTLPITLAETFESADGFDLEGWTNTSFSSTPWTWNTVRSQTPSHSWHAQGQSFNANRILTSPLIQAGPASTLTFWHTYEFESCFDGGTLEVSEDGFKWAAVPTFAFVTGGYTETVYGSNNPIFGRPAWCHGTLGAMTQVQVSLALWQGKTIQVRWHAGDDFSVASPGWYVDSINFHNVIVDNGCTAAPPPALDFYTLTPCRLLDTRAANAPVLQPGQLRTFQIAGTCGVPATAKALSVNITAASPTAPGEMILFQADQTPPLSSSISFKANVNRANNGVISLSPTGEVSVQANTTGAVHLILDVNGYFQEE